MICLESERIRGASPISFQHPARFSRVRPRARTEKSALPTGRNDRWREGIVSLRYRSFPISNSDTGQICRIVAHTVRQKFVTEHSIYRNTGQRSIYIPRINRLQIIPWKGWGGPNNFTDALCGGLCRSSVSGRKFPSIRCKMHHACSDNFRFCLQFNWNIIKKKKLNKLLNE